MHRVMRYAAVMAAAFTLMCAVPANAQGTVDEKTQLTFTEPVMVPGMTLQPGTYTFQVVNSDATNQLVQILDQNGGVKATMMTVPIRRAANQVKGDTVLKFNPASGSSDAPVALKGWFYPGRMYGHEFVYSDTEARDIAQRTRTIVLSSDAKNGDAQKGQIFAYDASGQRRPWTSEATVRTAPAGSKAEAAAPMMRTNQSGMKVKLNQLEENGKQYVGKTVTVDAEVDDVLGPRLFKIDEPGWVDMDPEILVYVPTDLAALVKQDDRVTITGTMKTLAQSDLDREFNWLASAMDFTTAAVNRPVLVAQRIVGGDNDVALVVDVATKAGNAGTGAVGTTGSSKDATPTAGNRSESSNAATTRGPAVTDLQGFGTDADDLVGRHVDLQNVAVAGRAAHGNGFLLRGPQGQSVFVLPAHADTVRPADGTNVSISGVVLEMPRSMRDQFVSGKNVNTDVYVYAAQVTR